ncbi:hypothetical protein AA313_de0207096 [Arthrobotrys entomopaga]|nr:hypothetical protein AA313_de0207096 [Arthrobotrys entomopaga]
MNVIREVLSLTRREIDEGIPDSASWHQDYRHTAYIFIGNLPFELSEGDIIAIFSQYGEPVHLHLARDKDTGKSRGFGWLKYEDQRSTNLAVDNLTGCSVLGRKIRVDHADYKHKEGDGAEEAFKGLNINKDKDKRREEDDREERTSKRRRRDSSDEEEEDGGLDAAELAERKREERELAKLERDHDEDDPMKDYLIREKKKEIEDARMEQITDDIDRTEVIETETVTMTTTVAVIIEIGKPTKMIEKEHQKAPADITIKTITQTTMTGVDIVRRTKTKINGATDEKMIVTETTDVEKTMLVALDDAEILAKDNNHFQLDVF